MTDPVMRKGGSVTYERKAILKWLDASGDNVCPVTGTTLARSNLVRNTTLAAELKQWNMCNNRRQRNQEQKPSPPQQQLLQMHQCPSPPAKVFSAGNRRYRDFTHTLDSILDGTTALSVDRESSLDTDSLLSLLDEAVECSSSSKLP
jgi:hypothetical protein